MEIRKVDFDWSGEEGIVRYPGFLNRDGSIPWPQTVKGWGLITRSMTLSF